jgi:hypothetical protein
MSASRVRTVSRTRAALGVALWRELSVGGVNEEWLFCALYSYRPKAVSAARGLAKWPVQTLNQRVEGSSPPAPTFKASRYRRPSVNLGSQYVSSIMYVAYLSPLAALALVVGGLTSVITT